MYIELATEERQMLVDLLESRVDGLGPQIRRSREYLYRNELKDERQALAELLQRLKRAGDVKAHY